MIKVDNLTKIYNQKTPNEVCALNGVSFNVEVGEIINIIGKSGSGKTTLSNVLLGITKPTNGSFRINDLSIDKKSKRKKLRLITNELLMSFQYPTHQLFAKNVKDEILFNTNGDEKKMNNLISMFDFPKELLDKSPFKLSSGQKRKLILMSLLMQEPNVLIFDEATAFLDATSRRQFIEIIKKVNADLKTTMIFISHNLHDAQSLSDRTILLDNGKIIADGKTSEVIKKYMEGDFNG